MATKKVDWQQVAITKEEWDDLKRQDYNKLSAEDKRLIDNGPPPKFWTPPAHSGFEAPGLFEITENGKPRHGVEGNMKPPVAKKRGGNAGSKASSAAKERASTRASGGSKRTAKK